MATKIDIFNDSNLLIDLIQFSSDIIILTNPKTNKIIFCNHDELEIFNAVTPNGNGDNDVFVIRNIERYQENELEIYNRWGQLVWETDIVSEGWNVRSKDNKDVQLGTYTWKIKYKTLDNDNKEILIGHVFLLR